MRPQFQAATVGVDGWLSSALVPVALAEKEERVGLFLVIDGRGLLEQRDGLLEPILAKGLQAFGVFAQCLEPFDFPRLAVLRDQPGHQSADLRIEPVPQRPLEGAEHIGRIFSGGLPGESEFDQRFGGRSITTDERLDQLHG